jgi:hypothetical protein
MVLTYWLNYFSRLHRMIIQITDFIDGSLCRINEKLLSPSNGLQAGQYSYSLKIRSLNYMLMYV